MAREAPLRRSCKQELRRAPEKENDEASVGVKREKKKEVTGCRLGDEKERQ